MATRISSKFNTNFTLDIVNQISFFFPYRSNTTPTLHEAQLELRLFNQDMVYRTESSAIKA
jgi:hypothetical protein